MKDTYGTKWSINSRSESITINNNNPSKLFIMIYNEILKHNKEKKSK